MSTFSYELAPGEFLRIGYRSPGLTASLDPKGKMDLAHELGMEIIEPQYGEKEFPTFDTVEALAKAASDAGIKIPSMGTFAQTTDPAQQGKLEAYMNESIRAATTLGATYIFCMAPYPPADLPQPAVWDLLIDNTKRICDMAGQAGLTVGFEPEWFIGTNERLARLLRLVNRPNLVPNYDPTNLYLYGSDPVDTFGLFQTEIGSQIQSGHIKDGMVTHAAHHETRVGEGELDYTAIFTAIKNRGKSINMHIEHCTSTEQVKADAVYIRNVLEKIFA